MKITKIGEFEDYLFRKYAQPVRLSIGRKPSGKSGIRIQQQGESTEAAVKFKRGGK